jgi:hypothetical protein
MNFCPPVVPQSGTEGGKRFRNSALVEYQNRKIFVSLIEKNFEGARLKDVKKIFLFCSPSGGRKRWVGLSPAGRQSKVDVRILFKISSDFVQKVPPKTPAERRGFLRMGLVRGRAGSMMHRHLSPQGVIK